MPHHTEGRHPHPNAHRHTHSNSDTKEGWETAWPPRERRLRKRIQGLERTLQGVLQDLERWGARRRAPRQQDQGASDTSPLRDENPRRPLTTAKKHKQSFHWV